MIYFAQSTDGGPVKIGFTDDVEQRHRQLEARYGRELVILATMPGDRGQEAQIHARFRRLRLGNTEQFRPTAELMAFIGRPLLVDANPDAVEVMTELKAVRLELSPETHKALRIEAAKQDMSMAALVRGLVEEYLAKRKGSK